MTIRIEHDGALTTLTLARPEKLNALDVSMIEALDAAFTETEARAETRVVILTGEGKAFVAGADIASMAGMSMAEAESFGELGHRVFRRLETSRLPVIAAVNGFALGGGLELALACDFIHTSDNAKLGLPETGLGIIPGFGGTQRLPRRVGLGLARELIFTGRTIDAAEALRIGLVNGVHPRENLLGQVRVIADQIATKGPLAIAHAKRLMVVGADLALPKANELEIEAFSVLFPSEDRIEGMQAFVEKRPPDFTGA
jgi:enoyl-CoA hydratase